MTEHNYSVFCNQKQGSTKNVNAKLSGNLNGATYFFLAPRSLRSLGIYDNKIVLYNQAQIHTSHITPMLTSLLNKTTAFYYTFTPEGTIFLK